MSAFARILGAVGLKLPVFGPNRAGAVPAASADPSSSKFLAEDCVFRTVAGGSGDVVGPAASVASELALFDGTTGKLIKRATGSGLAKITSGVLSAVTTWTGAGLTGTASRLAAFDGSGNPTAVAVGTGSGDVAAGDAPAAAVSAHVGLSDPHTQYALESALGSMSTQAANAVNISGGAVTGITDLAVADGGTGASDATTARANLLPAGAEGDVLRIVGGVWVAAAAIGLYINLGTPVLDRAPEGGGLFMDDIWRQA